MSNLPVSQLPRVFAQMSKNGVTVMIGNRHYRRSANDREIFNAAQDYINNPSQELLDDLNELVNPSSIATTLFNGEFYEDERGRVFLKGTNVPVPPFLVARIKEAQDNEWPMQPLINFWSNSLLCPYPQQRDAMFTYCEKYQVPISDLGYMVMYKAVVVKQKADGTVPDYKKDLAHYVGEAVDQARRWKKGRQRFTIYFNETTKEFRMSEGAIQEGEKEIGNLEDLSKNIEELGKKSETIYTDKWTKTMEIRLGQPVRKDHGRKITNPRLCSEDGVHIGSYEYVVTYGKKGDIILMCLVNPKDVLIVNSGAKIQVTQYLPIGVMVGSEQREWQQIESDYFETDYIDEELEGLLTLAKQGRLGESEQVALTYRKQQLKEVVQGAVKLLPETKKKLDTFVDEVEE